VKRETDHPDKSRNIKILFISNGYGEDIVAAHLAGKIRAKQPEIEVAGYPTVGRGRFYTNFGVELAGIGVELPSEGFIRSFRDFIGDLQHGFFGKTLRLGRRLGRTALGYDYLIPVGDAYILLFTSIFTKQKPQRKILINIQQTEWYGARKPFKQHYSLVERMWTRRMTRFMYVRDAKTRDFLQAKGLHQANSCGNPMMDCFTVHDQPVLPVNRMLIGVLPGSKQEAYTNLITVFEIVRVLSDRGYLCNYAIALSPQLDKATVAARHRLKEVQTHGKNGDELYTEYRMPQGEAAIFISQSLFGDILNESVAVIGISGTGNEQAAGMGKPVFGFWGRGPQITEKFMRAQKKLLGPSLELYPPDPEAIAEGMIVLFNDPGRQKSIAANGMHRMAGRGSIDCMVKGILEYINREI
jgi:uncharacterized protein (TIGR03492 family)